MKRVVLCLLDGLGYREDVLGNVFYEANTPSLDKLLKEFPNSKLISCGNEVGQLMEVSNSKLGLMAIGTGRKVLNMFDALNGSTFYDNENLSEVLDFVKDNKSRLHIFSIVNKVYIQYLFSFIDLVNKINIPVYLHLFLEGEAKLNNTVDILDSISSFIEDKNCYIASLSGKHYILGDDVNCEDAKIYYDTVFKGLGTFDNDYKNIIKTSYDLEIYNSYVVPTLLNRDGVFSDCDGFIIFNFDKGYKNLFDLVNNEEENIYSNIKYVSMFPIDNKCKSIFSNNLIDNSLISVLNDNNIRVLRLGESSKYKEITKYFDGNKDNVYNNVSNICIPKKSSDYVDDPSVGAYEITEKVINIMMDYDFILVDYANCDLVAKSGNYEACKKTLEIVDKCIMNLYEACFNNDYLLIISSSCANIEEMIKNGNIYIENTSNDVCLIVCDKEYKVRRGSLCDIAPSVISVLGLTIPEEMTGNIIIY